MNVRTVDLSILRENIRLIRASLPERTKLMAVVKADGYGHGLVQTARSALEVGASWLAVARTEEGVWLREAGIDCPVLVLGAALEAEAPLAIEHSLHMTICSAAMVEPLARAAQAAGKPALVHLKLDTGMSRIGARTAEEVSEVLEALKKHVGVRLEGAYTHFADADGDDMAFTRQQLAKFRALTEPLAANVLRHCANSAAIHRLPEACFDMVRAGISMYGYPPVSTDMPLRPAMGWHTRVSFVKDILPGDAVSYGCTFRAQDRMRIATVACGYGDGYHRAGSGKAEVLIRGRRARIVGCICMDQMMADVTGIPGVEAGDEVVLMGRQGDEKITAEDLAAWAGTISYEVLLAATARVERVWRHEWMDKQTLRQAIRSIFPGEAARNHESLEISRHLLQSDLYARSRVIAAYVPLAREADISPVLEDALRRGKTLLLPRVADDGNMELCRVENLEDLKPGRYGIPEPQEDAEVFSPDQADLIITPLEALDDQGMRLGKGGGYYDRLLRQRGEAVALGAVLSWQWTHDVPATVLDQSLDAACDRQGIRNF